MVTNTLLNIVLGLFSMVFSVLPDISFDVSSSMYTTFTDIVAGVLYLLPVDTILTIMGIVLTILVFKVFVAIPKAIWDLIPFV